MKIYRYIFGGFVVLLFASICFAQTNLRDKVSVSEFDKTIAVYKTFPDDNSLKEKIIAKLREKGFTNVQVEVSNDVVTLRGTVPKGKMGDVIQLVFELKPKKVENQLTEER